MLVPSDLDDVPFALYAVADKYELDKLKSMCELFICLNLTEETVVDALILATRFGIKMLLVQTKLFFQARFADVQQSQENCQKLKANPDLLSNSWLIMSLDIN